MHLSERNLIEHIRKRADISTKGLIKGIGDDCSVFGSADSNHWLISTDMLVDGIHFERKWHSPRLLGRKSIAVNLSDIAAMGGIPRFVLLSVSIPSGISSEWLFQWLEGVYEILEEFNCCLIGGDTVSGKELNISVTILGEQHPSGVLYRSGAKIGDTVYVSSPLGSSAVGLAILEKSYKKKKDIEKRWEPFVNAHLDPVPQVRLGQVLCASGCVSAMQDISDGLATDLGHICKESCIGAVIRQRLLPVDPSLPDACSAFDLNELDCILKGGEDYQLVFTVRKGMETVLEEHISQFGTYTVAAIGKIVSGQGVFFEEQGGTQREIAFQGYEHKL